MIKTIKIESPIGDLIAGATDEGVCLLEYCDTDRSGIEFSDLGNLLDMQIEEGDNEHLVSLRKQLTEYFNGSRKVFTINIVAPGTDFQKAVWKELQEIPFGKTRSYIEQARVLKKPGSVRAVANANGKNRISILIPCHRVIGADGSLTGYGGGLKRKKWLLDHEKKHSGEALEMELF
jgi:AraC family transcriptional regulator, regulatory protein of adaptative response / methylated-DNA-[protein]-cysteine methyltransferase